MPFALPMRRPSFLIALAALALGACTTTGLKDAEAIFDRPDLMGLRWGIHVTTLDGKTVLERRADERFTPASNTKIVTTAAVFDMFGDLSNPDELMRTTLALEPGADGAPPDILLVGGGDPAFSDEPDCEARCLSALVDEVVALGLTEVGNVIGDATVFPEERWGPGWTWDDFGWGYGAPVSGLMVDENRIGLTVFPPASDLDGAGVQWDPGDDLFPIIVDIGVGDGDAYDIASSGAFEDGDFRLYGRMPVGTEPDDLSLAVDRPAHAAATRLKRRLDAAGVVVSGEVLTRTRKPGIDRQAPETATTIAATEPPVLIDLVTRVMKDSSNVTAEALLRRLALEGGSGSSDEGLERVVETLQRAGANPLGYAIADGSGMSIYNRLSPRVVTTLLVWASDQSWFEAFYETFPIGGVDGSLRRRFVGTPLQGRIHAKTGTLRGVNALSGYMIAESGQTLVFSILANDRPLSDPTAIDEIDAALVAIATVN